MSENVCARKMPGVTGGRLLAERALHAGSAESMGAIAPWCRVVAENEIVPDEVFEQARAQFNEEPLVALAIVAINGWNRLAITFRSEPGTYQPLRVTKTG